MKRLIYKSFLPIMTAISVIACFPAQAEPYQMGDLVTIPIEMPITSIIVTPDVYCTEPNAPPVCLVKMEDEDEATGQTENTKTR